MAALDPIAGVLGLKGASHLLRRTTFGLTWSMVDEFKNYTIDQAITILFAPVYPPQDSEIAWLVNNPIQGDDINEGMKMRQFKAWLLERMLTAGSNATEKITFFLHTHLTTIASVVVRHTSIYNQNKFFRKYAFGNLKMLVRKVCSDNAMLVLLDGNLNVNGNPNENFARELLELYTIGKGAQAGAGDYTNYTEQDVKEAARVLSGFNTDFTYTNIDPVTAIPTGIVRTSTGGQISGTLPANRHDAGLKNFSARFNGTLIAPKAKSGNFATVDAAQDEVDQLINMIFGKVETAKNFCRKLYRFFVYYKITPEIENEIINPLAELLISSNFEMMPVLQKLLKSQHFFDLDNTLNADDARGAIIKSPIDLSIGIMAFLNAQRNATPPPNSGKNYIGPYESILAALEDQGMSVYEPLDVAGYDAYSQAPNFNRNWISPNFLANRYLFPHLLLNGNKAGAKYFGYYVDIMAFVNDTANVKDPSNATLLIQEAINYLLPEPISEVRLQYFRNVLLNNFGDSQWAQEWSSYKTTGDDRTVRTLLESFYWTILKSPEYQLK